MFKILALIASLSLLAVPAFAQSGAFPNYPIVGGAAYSCGSVNGVSNCTVPAGPTIVTGNENIPANTNLSGGRSPQNVLLSLASLNALPIQVAPVVLPASALISASNISGGVLFTSATTITAANITLPVNPVDGQQYRVSSNRTITTLSVTVTSPNLMGGNSAPTVLTASTTAPQGYLFRYNTADLSWYRLQ